MANGNLALKLTIQADGTALVQATQQGVRGLKEVGDQAGRTSVQIRGVGEANSKVSASFSDIGKGAVVFTAVASLASRAASAVAELPRAGIGFAAEIETAQLGIAGVLTSMTEVNGQAVQFVQSQGIARTITRQLADDAARTAASTTELVGAFQALVGPGLAAGMTVQQIRELAVTGVSAVKALGLEQRQVVQELRDLVQGGITPASSTLATALGLKDADIAKARSSADGLFNFLTERLKGFEQASDAFATTFSGRLQALQEQATRSSAAALAPVIAEIGNQAALLTQALKDESGVRTLEAIANAAAQGVRAVGELVRLGLEYSAVLGTLATAYVGLKLGGVVASLAEKARVTGQASEASRLAAVTAAAEGQASAAVAQTTRQEIAAKIAGLQATVTATQGERALAQAKVASLQSHAASIAQGRVAAQVQLQEANTTQRAALAIGAHSAALAAARQAAAQRAVALRELASLGTAQAAVERQLTAAQVASQTAANNATTAVQRLTAAKGAAGFAAGAAAAAGRGFSAVIGALGGPVGIAITAVTLLIGKLVQMRAEAARAAGANLSEERVRTALDNNQPVDDFDLGGLNTGINQLKQRRDALELDFRKLRDQGLAATDAVALATVTAAGGIDTSASFASEQLQGHIDQLGQLDTEIKSKSDLAKRAADAANEATSGIGLNAAQSGKALANLLEDVKTATGLREKAKQQTEAITAATTREVAALRQRNASSSQIAAVEGRSAEAVKAIQTKLNSDLKSLNEQGASDAKAIAEGRFAVTKAVAEQVAEIERNTLALFAKANEEAYAKGTRDATAYYAERARLQTADLDLQEKALSAELVAAQAAAESARKTEDIAHAQARVVEITTKLIALGRERLQVDGPDEAATREWEAYAAAAEKRYAAAADGADALEVELRNLQFEGMLIGQTVAQVQALERARAEEMAVAIERQAVLFRDIDLSGLTSEALERQARLIREIANQKAGNAAAQSTAEAWKETARSIYDGLTDSLFRAFEAGRGFFNTLWDGIKNLFKTTVLKLVIQGVVGGVLGSVGLAGANDGASGGGGAVGLAQNASTLNTVYNIGAQYLTGSAVGASAASLGFANIVGAVGGDALGALIAANGGYAGVAVGSAAGAGAAAGGAAAGGAAASGGSLYASAAAAGPYVVAALAVLNALGVFRSKKIVDGGLQGELGGQVNDYALQRKGGTLFSGPSYRVLDQGVSAQNQALQDSYTAIRDTVAGMAEQLGLGNDAIKLFTVQLGSDLIHPDTGGFGIKTQGLSQEEIIAKIEAALLSANDQLAQFALGTQEYTRESESASQTLARLVGALNTVNGVFSRLGLSLIDVSKSAPDAAQKFIDLFGGAEQFNQVASSYYQNFYTEAERTAATVEALRQRFFELGTAGATTREGFRALLEETVRLNGATSPVVAELLKLESTFASVVPANAALIQSELELTEARMQSIASQEMATASFERAGRLSAERAREADLENRKIESIERRNAAGGSLDNVFRGGLDVFIQQFGSAQTQAEQIIPEWLTSLDQIDNLFTRNLISRETMEAWSAGLTTVRNAQSLAAGALTDTLRTYSQAISVFDTMQSDVVSRYVDSAGNFNRDRPNAAFSAESLYADQIAFDSGFYQSARDQILQSYQAEAVREVARVLEVVGSSSASAEQKVAFLTATLGQLDNLSLGTSESANALRGAISELDGTLASVADRVAGAEQALRGAYNTQANELQQVIDKQKEYAQAIKDYRLGLDTSAAALLSPEAQYAAARQALQGASPEDFTRLADEFLEASRGYNASSSAYFADLAAVKELAQNAEINALATADVSQLQLTALEAQVSALITINESVLSVEQAIAALAAARGTPIPGFANGGDFGGGLRIVGERGIELEATGPSRIFNASQTRQILSGGGGRTDNSELVNEMRALRKTSESTARMLQAAQAQIIDLTMEGNELRRRLLKRQERAEQRQPQRTPVAA